MNNELLFDLVDYNEVFSRIKPLNDYRDNTCSGVGFCMAINMQVWREIGEFDIDFGIGYGEEVDWSCRATEAGYVHKIVPNLFVPHFHGGRFGSEQSQTLKQLHNKILFSKHPQIMSKYFPNFIEEDSWKDYRALAKLLLLKQPVLVIDTEKVQFEMNRFEENTEYLCLNYSPDEKKWKLYSDRKEFELICYLHSLYEIEELFENIEIKKCVINSIYLEDWEELHTIISIICQMKERFGVELTYAYKSTFPICPLFCAEEYGRNECNDINNKKCNVCLLRNSFINKNTKNDINSWRNMFLRLFSNIDYYCLEDKELIDLLNEHYPMIE